MQAGLYFFHYYMYILQEVLIIAFTALKKKREIGKNLEQ